MASGSPGTNTVIRLSPMAHTVSIFIALVLAMLMPAFGRAGLLLLVIPILLSVAIERVRTVANADTVTAQGLLRSRTLEWSQIEGLEFTRGGWARARLADQSTMQLPTVTFATLPRLTAASGGRVPNPYLR